jgi:hypothetical protein
MKARYTVLAGIAALATSTAVYAAHADYYLKIDTVEGEAMASDWSFGACNAGQCTTISSPRDAASSQSAGKSAGKGDVKVTASQNTQSLRESPTRASSGKAGWDLATGKGARSAGGVNVAAGDVDGDGLADLAYVATQSEVSSFTLTFQKIEATWRQVCNGKHIAKATLRTATDSYELSGVTVSCAAGASGAGGLVRKQTQGSSFGERCDAGVCTADGGIDMVLTGGQMKHTKTGHVTLLK